MIFTNPSILFISIWGLIGILFNFQLSNVLTDLKIETIVLIIISCSAFAFAYMIYFLMYKNPILYPYFDIKKNFTQIINDNVFKKIKKLVFFWIICTGIEIIIAGNLPLLSILGFGKFVGYTDFGIRGLHGFLNSIFLFLASFYFLKYKITLERKNIFIVLFMIAWTILVVNRQLMLSLLIELLFLHLITTKIKIKKLLKLIALVILAIVAFGLMGDFRSGREHFLEIASPNFYYPDYLPSGFLWVYIYMLTPLNNVNFNITTIEPTYIPLETIILLFPSFLRDNITSFIDRPEQNFILVHDSFNMSSFYPALLIDYGIELLFFPLLLSALLFLHTMHKSNNNIKFALTLAIFLHAIAMSVFTNFFTHIVFVMQIFIVIYVFNRFKYKKVTRLTLAK
jgi:oligosaccharide repeat unit polymerase